MIDLLLKTFVKDYDKTKDPQVRTRYGIFAGIVGIICNLILFSAKIIAGVLTASVSIMADAVNNLSDAGSSVVTLIGFKLAGKPADYEPLWTWADRIYIRLHSFGRNYNHGL